MERKLKLPKFIANMRKLHGDMSVLFSDDKYHDLKITCRGVEFRLHRAILLPRCDFFRACFESGFQEGNLGAVSLDDDHPEAVRMALFEIYTRDPDIVKLHFTTNETANLDLLVQIWKVADKYQLGDLALQCLAFIDSEIGLNLLKTRSGDEWTRDLLAALIETKGLKTDGEDEGCNKEMRDLIKKQLLASKSMTLLNSAELTLLKGDAEVATELLILSATRGLGVRDANIPAYTGLFMTNRQSAMSEDNV